jgi:DNA-binding HxlR family transcriptional regulator
MHNPRKLSSSNYANQQALARCCVLNDTLYRVGMRWKMQVLFCIEQGICSFGALKRELPGISDHVLGKRLRELQAESLLDRDALGSYTPTPRGRKLLAIMQDLCGWELESPPSRTRRSPPASISI